MAAGGEGEKRSDPLSPVIDIFAFFAAMRNYSYLDILGNALERTTALEALGNAVRDFRSTCLDASPESRHKLEAEKEVKCPRIDPEELEKAVNAFNSIMINRERSGELVVFLREVYVKALSRASRFKVKSQGGEAG